MSVSLVILRFEIANDLPLPNLHFVAPKLERTMHFPDACRDKEPPSDSESHCEKGETDQDSKQQTNEDEEHAEKQENSASKKKYRGTRELHEITIETFNDLSDIAEVMTTVAAASITDHQGSKTSGNQSQDYEKEVAEPDPKCQIADADKATCKIDGAPLPPSRKKRVAGKTQIIAADKTEKCENTIESKQTKDIPSKESNVLKQKEGLDEECSERHSSSKLVKRSANVKESSPPYDLEMQKETSPTLSDSNISASERRLRGIAPLQVPFYSGNHFVEVTKGILHLYKENQRTPLAEEAERSEMLCILAVSAIMTTHDLLQFVAPINDNIEHMRIIRESKPNQYMVLLKFKSQQTADEFYKNFNGVRFNSIEPEICHLVYVAKVESIKESEEAYLPVPGHTELPTCPVCLERMDESVEGILTILCNHSFHSSCLAKWGDTSCPVCRYSQTPELEPDNRCFGCGSQESLWICLICGHIGCGRYIEGHAYKHYLETQHTYAMQLGNNRVWDYAGDNYVHRLVQNKADGKPVELEPHWMEQEEKFDSIQLEYTYLLTSQLEAQRHFFESRISRMEEEAHRQLEELKDKTKLAVEERKQLEEKLSRVSKEKQSQEKKISQLTSKVNKATTELKEEKEMNKCLRQNQQSWQQKVKEAERQIKDLQESKEKETVELQQQVRDLMFYLEARDTVENMPDSTRQEIQDGQIVMGAAAAPPTSRRRRKPR